MGEREKWGQRLEKKTTFNREKKRKKAWDYGEIILKKIEIKAKKILTGVNEGGTNFRRSCLFIQRKQS